MEDRTIGQRIAAERRQMNLSQIALGELMGVTRQSISKWEADAAIPEIDKLIALSKLFHVSVGWLLGVEENPEPTQEPEREFTDRERELIDMLSRSRPAPVWQKYVTIAAAVCAAAALTVSGFALYRTTSFRDTVADEMQTISNLFSQLTNPNGQGIPDLLKHSQLDGYDFTVTPWHSMDGADFLFTARPMYYEEGMKAELNIWLGTTEVAWAECTYDGYQFGTDLSLPAADGYEIRLTMTTAKGITVTNTLTDPVLQNLGSSMHFGDPSVTFDGHNLSAEGLLTLNEVTVRVPMPDVYRDTTDLWDKCDLVIYRNGAEADRVDLLNRSQYSKQIDFSDADVDFTTRTVTFELGEAQSGDEIRLELDCEFTNGLTLRHTAGTWTLKEGRLVI